MARGPEVIAKEYLYENYDCNEYFSKYEDGYYYSESYLQVLLPLREAIINADHQHLVIGNAGSDGIEFCYRIREAGIWTYYLVDARFEKVADSISQFLDGWCNGSIKV